MEDQTATTVPQTVRLSAETHARVKRAAAVGHRSVSAEIALRVADSFEPRRPGLAQALSALELPRAVRFPQSNTTQAIINLVTVCRELEADALTFAARPDRLNGALLVTIVQTPSLVAIMDSAWLNLAREPRIAEVEDLFCQLDAMGLLRAARACMKLVPDTSTLPPADAVDLIAREGDPQPLDLPRFLKLLSGHGLVDPARFQLQEAAA